MPGQSATDQVANHLSQDCGEAFRWYATTLADRITSFDADPLHSASYLTPLTKYLKSSIQKPHPRQHSFEKPSGIPRRPFLIQHVLQQGRAPTSKSFDHPCAFANAASPAQNEIIFLAGRPSADWLNCIGSKYSLDHRFFHQHLSPLISGQRHWNAAPDLPSRSLQVISLRIPTVVFVGSQGRNLHIRDLELARENCNIQLRRNFQPIQHSAASEVGRSIIRRVEIYDGSTMVIEQQMTTTIVHRGNFWTILLWSDAGNEADHSHIPVPSTKEFALVASDLSFCPVFFENDLCRTNQELEPLQPPSSRQPLALLNARYGSTIDWSTCPTDAPLVVLQELFMFKAASALQYVNMIDQVLSEVGSRCDFPSYEHTKLETTVQYDYIKSSLIRFKRHCSNIIELLENPPAKWKKGAYRPGAASDIIHDFNYLVSRLETLLKTCEDGKATLVSNDSVQEAKRSSKEAELVTQLTKATNRLTFIFLPISFVTSLFGMNFNEFGQGPLSIWIWGVITLPLLILSVLIVERGQWFKAKWRQFREKKKPTFDKAII